MVFDWSSIAGGVIGGIATLVAVEWSNRRRHSAIEEEQAQERLKVLSAFAAELKVNAALVGTPGRLKVWYAWIPLHRLALDTARPYFSSLPSDVYVVIIDAERAIDRYNTIAQLMNRRSQPASGFIETTITNIAAEADSILEGAFREVDAYVRYCRALLPAQSSSSYGWFHFRGSILGTATGPLVEPPNE